MFAEEACKFIKAFSKVIPVFGKPLEGITDYVTYILDFVRHLILQAAAAAVAAAAVITDRARQSAGKRDNCTDYDLHCCAVVDIVHALACRSSTQSLYTTRHAQM